MKAVKAFIQLESSSGIVLGIAALAAVVLKNSSAEVFYDSLVAYPVGIKPALVWVNDVLMSFFFFLWV